MTRLRLVLVLFALAVLGVALLYQPRPAAAAAPPPAVPSDTAIQITHQITPSQVLTDIVPGAMVQVLSTVVNGGTEPVQLSFAYQAIDWVLVDAATAQAAAASTDPPRQQPPQIFTLAAGETRTFTRVVKIDHFPGSDDPNGPLTPEVEAVVTAEVCLVTNAREPSCTRLGGDGGNRRIPHRPLRLRLRFDDLGDAPDSTNHFGVPMSAYPGVPANFPTVWDAATGLPRGPRHSHPFPFHLGKFVSPETGADVGIDADGIHNLKPALDQANLDGHDDGIRPAALSFAHCERDRMEVVVFISPRAVAYFRQQNQPGFLNVWLDGNRDGDWADFTQCPPQENQPGVALEHIVIDFPVDAATLGAGLHVLTVPTGRVPWSAEQENKPAWLRLTLSEEPSVKPLVADGMAYGDGRGLDDRRFKLGETEDYLLRPADQPGVADMAIRKEGRVRQEFDPEAGQVRSKIAWFIEYGNRGDTPAENVVIHDRLSDVSDVNALLTGVRTIPQIPYGVDGNHLVFRPGNVPPGEVGRIFIVVPAQLAISTTATITNVATVTATNDLNLENNRAVATVTVGLRAPRILRPVDGTTCSTAVTVEGRAEAGAAVDLYIDETLTTTLTADAQGFWMYNATLTEGTHTLYAVARIGDRNSEPSPTVTLIVDASLSWDPISLRFTDPRGLSRRPVDENGRTDAAGWDIRLRPNTTYTVSVRLCCDEPNASVTLTVTNQSVLLTDPDGDGLYTGSFTTGRRNPAPGELTLTSVCGDSTVINSGSVVLIDPEGVVYDLTTGQPVAGSTVACLEGQPSSAGADAPMVFSLWNAADYDQVNPQSTVADGYFSFMTPAGRYQLTVAKSGYQPYRSREIAVVSEPVRYDVPLTPVVADAATQVIEISAAGFSPAVVTVAAGAVIEWVNVAEDGHTTTSTSPALPGPSAADATTTGGWDSGLLGVGESYKLLLTTAGVYTYVDAENPAHSATITVQGSNATTDSLFLPVITR
jgi:plastocyanin